MRLHSAIPQEMASVWQSPTAEAMGVCQYMQLREVMKGFTLMASHSGVLNEF